LGMTRRLVHRGPDGEGIFTEGGVGMGHRRLSIIDLKTGDQPMFSEDESVVVVFNGEIYNFRELRKDLESGGHRFTTSSDTEVLVHLYEEHGELFARKLNGIFAFALYDRKKKIMVLGRDPLGVKPLYYAECTDGLLFGSEPKALLKHRGFRPGPDLGAAAVYLQMEYYPAPLTPFREMKKLLSGHVLIAKSPQDKETIRYHLWKFDDLSGASQDEIAGMIRKKVTESVSSQLISDVPLGVFLSGGVDSACVAAAMKASGAEVRSFSIGFEDRDFDESRHAGKAGLHLGTDHSERIFSERELLDRFDPVLSAMDEPLADPSVFPTAILSGFARQKVTVALGGDGGDELFCGYPTYAVHKYFRLFEVTPPFIRGPILKAADALLPVTDGNLTFPYKLRKFMDGAEKPMPERHFAWMGAFNREALARLMPDIGPDFSDLAWIPPSPRSDRVTAAEWLDLHTYLMEDVLQKVDRMSMMSSLEVRVPLLDPSIVRLAFSIPPRAKMPGTRFKHLLKKAFARDLPAGYFSRPKKGFAIPISRWLRGPLKDRVRDAFSSGMPSFMDGSFAESLLAEHLSGRRDNRKQIWSLFVFLNWHGAYTRG
ncbi:MAG TPA: asparagine synthase (glutamine-hydrolyzing), partial [Acidobacteriota bacterium]|nr:asparagine synthase (glutamine-hydrolyzing) [Acidobacteriota bacterium]